MQTRENGKQYAYLQQREWGVWNWRTLTRKRQMTLEVGSQDIKLLPQKTHLQAGVWGLRYIIVRMEDRTRSESYYLDTNENVPSMIEEEPPIYKEGDSIFRGDHPSEAT